MTTARRMPGIIGAMCNGLPAFPEPPTNRPLPMVLLEHCVSGTEVHLDWMIARSSEGPLASWRIGAWPDPGQVIHGLEPMADHDRRWLTYQGVVSRGRGQAVQLDTGLLLAQEAVDGGWSLDLRWRGSGPQQVLLSPSAGGWSLGRVAR